MTNVRCAGVGSFVPRRAVKNERLVRAIPGWTAEKIAEDTGILERRFLWDFNPDTGRALVPPEDGSYWPWTNTDMGEVAPRTALEMADLPRRQLDGLFLITVSPDELAFCHDAMRLHERLGCRDDAFAVVVDSGCGGGLYLLDIARKMIQGGTYHTIAVVASTFTSAYIDSEVFTREMALGPGRNPINAFLSMYLFGDGAGAVILCADPNSRSGIVASTGGTLHGEEMGVRRGGGAMHPPHPGRATLADHAHFVDGPAVAQALPLLMQRCVNEVTAPHPEPVPGIRRYYLHQWNKRLVEHFVTSSGIPRDRVPTHIERYGNTSAASTFILMHEDLVHQHVHRGAGDLVLLAAVGAGVHYGAQLVTGKASA